jgi:uncharacterized protein (TIGR00255 family)
MTGFGAAHSVDNGRRFGVEVRSVNGRFLKCVPRVPDELRGLESDIEQEVGRHLRRGSVTVTVRCVDESAQAAMPVNVAALRRYVEQLVPLTEDGKVQIDLSSLVTLPGVLTSEPDDSLLEAAGPVVLSLVTEACGLVDSMRMREGAALVTEIEGHLSMIESHVDAISERAPQVVDAFQTRLRQRMEKLLSEVGADVRQEDLLREVAVFAERSDITEELSRLAAHLEQFRDLLSNDTDLVGRTMDFLSQEMLREANTIGSKCLDSEVGRRIVEVKGAVDRVKEQVQNLE